MMKSHPFQYSNGERAVIDKRSYQSKETTQSSYWTMGPPKAKRILSADHIYQGLKIELILSIFVTSQFKNNENQTYIKIRTIVLRKINN